ncbi:hypothetical protein [Brucella pseudogrignonensis]
MSMYEIVSMNVALQKLDKKHMPQVTDEDWAAAEAMLASVTVNDPSVQIG